MIDITAANAAIVPVTYGITEIIKKVGGPAAEQSGWFQRVLPLLPMLIAFGLTFVPGLGLAAWPLAAKATFALGAGGAAGWGNKVVKQTIQGQ